MVLISDLAAPAPPTSDEPLPTDPPPPSSVKPLSSEQAMRVSYIVRNYLSMRQSAPSSCTADRCPAMMEAVLTNPNNWTVSRLVTNHNHDLSPLASTAASPPPPTIGMVFDSSKAAKSFYYAYGKAAGFKPRMGCSRCSEAGGPRTMQRFICCRGKPAKYWKKQPDAVTRTLRRGAYLKIAPKRTAAANADPDVVEVVDVEKGEAVGEGRTPVKNAGKKLKHAAPAVRLGDAAGGPGKVAVTMLQPVDTARSRLLKELGIRVYRYTNEERRDIILKYMMKRNNRQVVEPPNKVPSQETMVEKRQSGTRGRSHSRHKQRISNGQVMTEGQSYFPIDGESNGGEPKVGMVFTNEDKAHVFYVKYAENVGFSVRKGWWEKSGRNITTSRVYVCSREGFRPSIIANEAKKPRPETRTGCPARMAIKITTDGTYSVSEFIAEHNHLLAAALDVQMLKSQRPLIKAQSGSRRSANLIPADYKNYLRSKRTKDMKMGDGGAVLEYLQKMKGDNPSFFYAIQVDEDDQLTNLFWADAKSMTDYCYFGDVVCFDTNYKAKDYGRPFAQFLGVNHHKQIVFFGSALMYDESIESFKWLFETFKGAMSGRQPKTILTDRCTAKSIAIAAVWPGTVHRICLWHIYQNAVKYLSHVFQSLETFSHDFSSCIYDCEDEEEFSSSWKTMLEKYDLDDNEWLAKLYEDREKWALAYVRQTFYADMQNILRRENFSSLLKEYLSPETDMLQFFEHHEKLVDEHRYAELQADYHASQGISGIPPLRLLWQAANVYTPTIFEMFRIEVDLSMNCMIYGCGDAGTSSEYEVTIRGENKGYSVRFDSSDGTVTCSCKKFESVGVQCCHVLKVLDYNSIKELPPQFILKRWKKDAKSGSIRENHGNALDDNPKSSFPKRYSSLCRMLYKIAARAAENVDAYAFLENQSDHLLEQVERILHTRMREKPTLYTATKFQSQHLVQGEGANHHRSETQGVSGKKKDGGVRRRQQSPLDMNKRQKGRKGQPVEAEASPRNNDPPVAQNTIPSHPRNPNQFFEPSQFVQGHTVQESTVQGAYVPAHQFGSGPIQGFHFTQEFSASALHQQSFHGSGQLGQACTTASDIHSLQFVATPNPQLVHQNDDQGHYSIPVWDFL